MIAALRHHGHSFRRSVARLAAAPGSTLLNALVFGVALALPFAAYVLISSVQAMLAGLGDRAEVSVFAVPEASAAEVEDIGKRLRALDGVAQVRFVPKDAALTGLKRSTGIGDVVDALRQNPLPDAFVVTLSAQDADLAERVAASAKTWNKVAHAQADSAWLRRLQSLLRAGRTAVWLLAAILAIALVAVTFNTIRLQVLTQRDEIEVSRLVGATDAYIRRPFLYLGTLQALLGALLAWGLVAASVALLQRDLAALGDLYGGSLRLVLPGLELGGGLLGVAAVLGWVGALLSVSRHLRAGQ